MAAEQLDTLSSARALIIGVRWGALAVSVATAAALQLDGRVFGATIVLVAVALARTLAPNRLRPGVRRDRVEIYGETVVVVAAAVVTGGLDSPLVFAVAGAGVLLGYGFGLSVATAVVSAIVTVLLITFLVDAGTRDAGRAVLGASQILLVTLVAGYARRIFSAEALRTSDALSRLQRLNEANDLLFELYRVAQTLPVSLDLGDTVALTATRIKEIFHPDGMAILLPDDTTGRWDTAVAEGVRARHGVERAQLPPGVRTAAAQIDAVVLDPLPEGSGLAFASQAGVYAALSARGQLVGVLAVERRASGVFTTKDASLLEGIAEQAALAIDNARWFSRLRAIGADQERTRIARELHDRVGQALAYLSFELDRLADRAGGNALQPELVQLRTDARQAVAEVREALYDLRTDVSETVGLIDVVPAFLERVQARSGLEIMFRYEGEGRLPLPHEREMLRIAQEAVTNVERHAGGRMLSVTWRVTPAFGELEVADDGAGFTIGRSGRLDSYGLVGMRERADAIGAVLEVDTRPGKGTTIRCRVRRAEQDGDR